MLSHQQAKAFYDRFGARQDAQAFYEDRAVDRLLAHSLLAEAQSVFELGCGTGRLAARLLATRLSPACHYHGVDVSSTMVGLARARVARFGKRARVEQSDGRLTFDVPTASIDRVLACYVLDLLSVADIKRFLTEARRMLRPGGLLCVTNLTWGRGLLPGLISALWVGVHKLNPLWVGGCRPLELRPLLDRSEWRLRWHNQITAMALTSGMLVAEPV